MNKLMKCLYVFYGITSVQISYGKTDIKKDFEYYKELNVAFDNSMKFSQQEPCLEKEHSPLVELCRTLYKNNCFRNMKLCEKELIPKIIHLIWVGPHTPPRVFAECKASIEKYLPDWECKIWTDKDIPDFKLYNQKFYDEERSYGAKADILRYEILDRFGGLYLDVDFVLLRPIDFLHHIYEFYTSMMPCVAPDTMANGIIACKPGHPIIHQCVLNIVNYRHEYHILDRTGPFYFQNVFHETVKTIPHDKIIAFPETYWLPLSYNQRYFDNEGVASQLRNETFAVHYWSNSW